MKKLMGARWACAHDFSKKLMGGLIWKKRWAHNGRPAHNFSFILMGVSKVLMGTKKRKNRWAHNGRSAHEIKKKKAPKNEKNNGQRPFFANPFFPRPWSSYPYSWGPWGPWDPYFKNIIYIFFPLERAPAGAQKVYRENSLQFLSMNQGIFIIS